MNERLMELLVEEWNRNRPAGTEVDVALDDGRVVRTRTRSEAWLLGDHSPVVMLESTPERRFSGGFALERCRPVED
jgi:hypothetical protein